MDYKARVGLTRMLPPDYHYYWQVRSLRYFYDRDLKTPYRLPDRLNLRIFALFYMFQMQLHVSITVWNRIAAKYLVSTLLKIIEKR